MKRRPFTSYTDAFYRVKAMADIATLGAEMLIAENDHYRASRGIKPNDPADLEATKERIRQTRTELNRLLRKRYGK